MSVARGRAGVCGDCGAYLDRRQGYCLGCGERVGSRSPQLIELLRRTRERGEVERRAPEATGAGPPEAIGASIAGSSRDSPSAVSRAGALGARLTLPSARISGLLVLTFLGFGVLLGNVAGSRVDYSLAASARPQLKLMLPPATAAPTSSGESSAPASGPPPSPEAEPTPPAASPAPAAAASPAPSSRAPSSSRRSQGGGRSRAPAGGSSPKLPAIKHVFVIMLSDQPYAAVFGPASAAPYLSRTLEGRGALLVRYYAVAHEQLANGIALLSGQGPTPATAANCPLFADIAPASAGAEQQVVGDGCVYPAATNTLAGQLSAKHLTWRAYVQGIDEAGSALGACGHPGLGQPDPNAGAAGAAGALPYASFRNPFVYFHSIIDSPSCVSDDVGLSTLSADLGDAKRTPSLSYIVPDRCHDGSSEPCTSGAPAGMPAADGFLKQIVPKILASKAYRDGGLLAITVDEAPSTGEFADSSSCCGQPQYPNLSPATAAAPGLEADGGGQVGALLLSPFVKPHTTTQEPYSHYSLLRTIEDVFALKHLGYAGLPKVSALEPSLFAANR